MNQRVGSSSFQPSCIQKHSYGSPSLRSRCLSLYLKKTLREKLTQSDVQFFHLRPIFEHQASKKKLPKGVRIESVAEANVKGEWQRPENLTAGYENAVLLYLHGGGYAFGSPATHRPMTAAIAKLAGINVFSLDYRLAPEHPFPAPVEDAVAAFQWLLGQGVNPERIIVAGDSAGGGLSLALLLALKEQKLPLPAGAFLLSPWTDMAVSGESHQLSSCAMFNRGTILRGAENYMANSDRKTPLASPLYADLSDLPPIEIHVSDSEVLRDDSLRIAQQAEEKQLPINIFVWKNQPHVWPFFYPAIPEAKRCIQDLADFIRQSLI